MPMPVNQHKLIVQWSGQVDLSSNPELRAAIDEFTNSKGHEKRSWTPESVKQRIEALETRYGTKVTTYLQIALLSIYRHASEIAHGTLSGALFSLGFTLSSGPPTSPEVLANYQRGNITMLLMVLGFSISSLLRVVANELPLEDLEDLVVESETALNKLAKEGWVK
jgi:hypothetical protein